MKAFRFTIREIEDSSESRIFRLSGYIDAHTVLEFEKAVSHEINSGMKSAILDLEDLVYISSAGIGAMMGLARRLAQDGGELVLLKPTAKVFKILDGLGFTKIFKIAADETEALEKLKTGTT